MKEKLIFVFKLIVEFSVEGLDYLFGMVTIKLPESITNSSSLAIGTWLLKFMRNKNDLILSFAHKLDRVTKIKEVLGTIFVVNK